MVRTEDTIVVADYLNPTEFLLTRLKANYDTSFDRLLVIRYKATLFV